MGRIDPPAKKSKRWLKKLTTAGAAALTAGSVLWVSVGREKIALPATEAVRVIDGDTFETKEGQHIRLASTEAPQLELCGGQAAKKRLEELVLDQPLYVKTVYVDFWKRPVALVYAGKILVNQVMLAEGLSEYERSSPGIIGWRLNRATQIARKEKKGIFGESCTQSVNRKNPDCRIKGNVGQKDKIYYLPDCGVYPNVEMELYKGDEWFCTEAQAVKAGFRKPSQCP
jgi:endonuclease YncB( thermonuclease family)